MDDAKRWERFRAEMPSLGRDTYDSFWSANPIAPKAPKKAAGKLVRLTTPDALKGLVTGVRGHRQVQLKYEAAFPGCRIIATSALGLSRDGGQALAYVHDLSDSSGGYELLTKRDGRWRIVKSGIEFQRGGPARPSVGRVRRIVRVRV